MPEVVSFAQKYGLAVPAQANVTNRTLSPTLLNPALEEELQKLMHASASWLTNIFRGIARAAQ